jgi:hypothetical protein
MGKTIKERRFEIAVSLVGDFKPPLLEAHLACRDCPECSM